jgi:FlaA1/EpsC-like NDP-sugar epimerase
LVADAQGNESPQGPLVQVSTPAKQHVGAVGDRMLLEMTSADQARIIQIEPRENILYRSDAFKSKIIASNVDQILVVLATQPAFSPDLLGRAVVAAEANQIGLQVLTIPAIDDLISGRFSVSQIRRVDVEDLLGRDPVNIDTSGLNKLIANKTVLVSGAGGSIGSELCRQIIKFNPKYIVCLDISEYALYNLEQEFSSQKLLVKFIYLVVDVKHYLILDKIYSCWQNY